MKELISIYVSLFLVFSPLYGQTKQEAQLMTQNEYERMDKWNIHLIGGDSFANVALWDLKGDLLAISDMGITRTISLRSIAFITATKVKSKAGKGAKIGLVIGAIIVVPLAIAMNNDSEDSGFGGPPVHRISVVGGAIFVGILTGVGGAIGSGFKQDKVYNMSDLSIEEKRAQFQKLMKK